MTDEQPAADQPGAAGAASLLARLPASAWSTLKTVYWANSRSWRFLKAGALLVFGFFLWAGSNVLHSYNDSMRLLYYPMAYGFVLIAYGPIHHLVVIPLAVKWRRSAGIRQRVGRRLPNAMLAVFLAAVVVLGTFPVGAMTIDFQASLGGGTASPDVSPELSCVKTPAGDGTRITCSFSSPEGVGKVVVESDGRQLATVTDPPYEFTIRERDLGEVTGEKQFTVVLLDEDGHLVRRYTRRLSIVPDA
ncbi:MAG: hypothetical protein ABEJ90_04885 [Halobacterium sp.]